MLLTSHSKKTKVKHTMIKILIDNGHGINTVGNCSPDKRLMEYAYTREIAQMLVERLCKAGYDAQLIVTEIDDVSLKERCHRVNSLCNKLGRNNVIFISIHVDAAGDGGKWINAGGWTAYTSVGQTKADKIAECLYDAAKVHLADYAKKLEEGKNTGIYSDNQKPFRTDTLDGDSDKEANFYVLKNTNCPAVLTENLFKDNKADVDFLLSPEGKNAIVNLHFDGIVKYINSMKI